VIKLLVERDDVNANSKDNYGQTPLSLAAWHGHEAVMIGPNGEPVPQQAAIDPSKLDFWRVIYDYTLQTQAAGIGLAVKKGDLVAVLSRTDPMGNASEWWRCRFRDGAVGYLPSPYLETIQRRYQQRAITAGSAQGSRTNTLFAGGEEQRTKSLSSVSALKNENNKRSEVKKSTSAPSAFIFRL
jgi:peroxin-13